MSCMETAVLFLCVLGCVSGMIRRNSCAGSDTSSRQLAQTCLMMCCAAPGVLRLGMFDTHQHSARRCCYYYEVLVLHTHWHSSRVASCCCAVCLASSRAFEMLHVPLSRSVRREAIIAMMVCSCEGAAAAGCCTSASCSSHGLVLLAPVILGRFGGASLSLR